jgi:hypothetical protein
LPETKKTACSRSGRPFNQALEADFFFAIFFAGGFLAAFAGAFLALAFLTVAFFELTALTGAFFAVAFFALAFLAAFLGFGGASSAGLVLLRTVRVFSASSAFSSASNSAGVSGRADFLNRSMS